MQAQTQTETLVYIHIGPLLLFDTRKPYMIIITTKKKKEERKKEKRITIFARIGEHMKMFYFVFSLFEIFMLSILYAQILSKQQRQLSVTLIPQFSARL